MSREPDCFDSRDVWVPSADQILMSSERAILAVLDVNLLLAVRTLEAEHASLGERPVDQPHPPHVALAESLVILAGSLREVIAGYRAAMDHLLGDA